MLVDMNDRNGTGNIERTRMKSVAKLIGRSLKPYRKQ